MSGSNSEDQQQNAAYSTAVAAIEAEINRIQVLALDDVRSLWRETFKKAVPKALTQDLLVRMLTWHIQERAFGGHDRGTLKILDSYVRGRPTDPQKTRYLKPGTEIVREYQGALQALLSAIEAGKIDVVVVYKVDRLTRSLADFAKLVELFDRHGVSFVSITQSFNTTTSMGRLTLNVLLSFAQFEREVIGERVRDKIGASKRKGLWVGGPVPLGYASVNKKLVVVPEEAETVRSIFRRYLDLGSVRLLAADLDKRGVRSKVRDLSGGRTSGGGRFGVGALSHFLKNRFYIGEVVYRGEVHAGEHQPILDRSLFEEVQTKIASNNVERQLRLKGSLSLLAGRIYDDRGNRMSPSHTVKDGVRYRYYVSNAIQQKRDSDVGSVPRVPAPEIENLVINAVREYCQKESWAAEQTEGDLLVRLMRIVITPTGITIQLAPGAPDLPKANVREEASNEMSDQEPAVIAVSWEPVKFFALKGIILDPPDTAQALKPESRDTILRAIAKARLWLDELVQDGSSVAQIAKREGKIERHIRLLLPLAFVSPEMVKAIANGSAPRHLTVTGLAKQVPCSWARNQG